MRVVLGLVVVAGAAVLGWLLLAGRALRDIDQHWPGLGLM